MSHCHQYGEARLPITDTMPSGTVGVIVGTVSIGSSNVEDPSLRGVDAKEHPQPSRGARVQQAPAVLPGWRSGVGQRRRVRGEHLFRLPRHRPQTSPIERFLPQEAVRINVLSHNVLEAALSGCTAGGIREHRQGFHPVGAIVMCEVPSAEDPPRVRPDHPLSKTTVAVTGHGYACTSEGL